MYNSKHMYHKVLVVLAVVLMGYVAVSKFMIRNDTTIGADSNYPTFWGIQVDVDTNAVPAMASIKVCWTNDINLINLTTPLAYRQAESNDWTVVEYPSNARIYTSGITNILEYTVANTDEIDWGNVRHWWVGEDRPGVVIIITGDDVKITDFVHDSEHVEISWSTSTELLDTVRATASSYSYAIEYVPVHSTSWQPVLEDIQSDSVTNRVVIPGFFYGSDRDWRVKLEYVLGGSHED